MKKSKYTKEFLSDMVAESHNWSDLLRNLGLKVTGGNHRNIKGKVVCFDIGTSHFKKGPWNKGLTAKTSEKVRAGRDKIRTPDELVFIEKSTYKSSDLYKRLIRIGWKDECSICGLSIWLDKPIRLHVDHKNGRHTDCRLENLRLLCPNCHSQTDTYSGKANKGPSKPRKKRRRKQERFCASCNKGISRNSKSGLCLKCLSFKRRTVERPSREILMNQIEEIGYCGTARIYGVSDNAIRKWLK